MFRKQGIDISSRGSFELPARLRIIVRVLSRSRSPFVFHPFSLCLFSLPSSFARRCDRTWHRMLLSLSSPRVAPAVSVRRRTTGQFIRRDPCFISSVASEMQPKRCKRMTFSASSSRPLHAFHAVALAVDSSGFYEPLSIRYYW